MNLTPLNNITYDTTNLVDDTTPAWNVDSAYTLDTIRQLNNKLYKALGEIYALCEYVYDNTDPLRPHYTVVANTGLEVADNTAVPITNLVTTVYVVDNNTYYIAKITGNVDFTNEDLVTPANFNIVGIGDTAASLRRYIYSPTDTPLKWDDLGYVNKYKCLDTALNSQTVSDPLINGGDITMSFVTSKVDDIFLLNLYASEITIVVTTDALVEIFNKTESLIRKDGGTFYTYFFNDFVYRTKSYSTVPIATSVTIDITIKPISGIAKVGLVGIGRTKYLGSTLYGAGVGMIDFSKKQINTSGETYLEQGNYKATNNLTVDIPSGLTDSVVDELVKYRGVPVVFGSSGFDSLVIFGVYNKFDILISTPTISKMSIDLESLI